MTDSPVFRIRRRAPTLTPMRTHRLRAGLTQADVAARTGISLGWISEVERQPAFLTAPVADRIAAALGCTAADLLRRDEE